MSKAIRQKWRKVYLLVFTSPSHIGLDPHALLVIVLCIVSATWDGESDGAEVLAEDGTPEPWWRLAAMAHMSVARFKKALKAASDPKVGTLVIDGERILIPKFRRWQEAPSTKRTRSYRERHGDAGCDADETVTVTTEERREKAEERTKQPPPPDPGHLSRKRPAPSSGLFADLDMYRRTLAAELQADLPSWGGSGGQAVDGIARALDELSGDLDQLRAVIRHTALSVADGSLEPVLFRRMWVGDGFGARLDAWRKASSKPASERRASAAELAEISESQAMADEFLAAMNVESA